MYPRPLVSYDTYYLRCPTMPKKLKFELIANRLKISVTGLVSSFLCVSKIEVHKSKIENCVNFFEISLKMSIFWFLE